MILRIIIVVGGIDISWRLELLFQGLICWIKMEEII